MKFKNKHIARISLSLCGLLSFGVCDAAKAESAPYDVSWEMTPFGSQITPPANLGKSQHAWSFEIVTDREQHHPNVIQKDAAKALKGTKKVDLEGRVRKSK